MAKQFLDEGRDKFGFVTPDGKLLQRTKGLGFSPNYPKRPSPPPGPPPNYWLYECPSSTASSLKPGDPVGSVRAAGSQPPSPNSTGHPCEAFQYIEHIGGSTTLGVLAHGTTDATQLCLAASSSGDTLTLALCGLPRASAPSVAFFKLDHNFTAPNHARPQQVVHAPSGKCVSLDEGAAPTLAECVPGSATQLFVYGTSGRLCSGGRCLSVGH